MKKLLECLKIFFLDKNFKIMRISFFLLFACFFQVFAANNYAQTKKLTLSMDKATIAQVLQAIEDQSEFKFFYNNQLIDVTKKVDVDIRRKNIWEALENVLPDAGITYRVVGKQVALFQQVPVSVQPVIQQQPVTGKVTDEDGNPLPGVNIIIKGTMTGTITNADGNYRIEVDDPDATLEFSFIGYTTQEVEIAGREVINITLTQEVIGLDEVVAIGYGTQTKRNLTGSISKLSNESFNQSINTSVDQMIGGKVAGVQVVQNSGEPGAGISIDIRGVGSINAGSSPLYVVDGLPIENSVLISGTGNQVASTRSPRNPISFLNPEDIESIEILKDASATAIYGARGANGVIMITTKKGAAGNLSIDYNGHIGVNQVSNRFDLLNPQEYMEGINAIIDDGYGSDAERVTEIQDGGTDWQDVIYRDYALVQKHNLSFSWGNAQTNYRISINNTNEEGMVKNTSFNRYAARFNLSHTTDKFNFGISTTSSYIKDIFVPNGFDVNLRGGAINAAKLYDPTLAIRDENGDYITTEFMDIDNPHAILYGNHMDGNRYRYMGTVFAEYFVIPSLSIKVRTGGDTANEDKTVYKDRKTIIGNSLGGVATAYSAMQSNYLIEGMLNYNQKFGEHKITGLAGITTQRFSRNNSSQQANNFTTDATLADNFGLADRETLVNTSSKSANSLLSYLGRVHYNYGNRYLLTASYRIDGSSRFGEGNRFGFFPSFSVGWLIDQEDFFPWQDVVNLLKLRFSWGKTGNQEIGNYQSLVTFKTGNRTSYVLNDQFVTSLNPSRIANPNLKWETTEQIDIGIDFSVLNRRIAGTVDWYKKTTTDMLLNLPVPTSSGYTSKMVNIGSIDNSGLEVALTTYNISGRFFSWNSDINFYTLKNEVKELGGIPKILTGGFSVAAGDVSVITPGEPLQSFYGYEVTGVWQQGDDFTSITNTVSPGDLKFRDVNEDGIINSDDRVILGNSFPDFSWGFGNTFKYKGLGLHIFLKGVEGVHMINGNLMEQYYPRSGVRINRFAEPFLNRWTPSNPTNDQPSYLNIDQHAQGINSITVADASYIKLQTVSLSYSLPADLFKGFLRSFEVYVSGLNLITFSDYLGHDPALNPNGSANFRIDWNGYPSARTYLFGVNIGF